MEEKENVFFHGSPKKLDTLRKGSWVTPFQEDAAVFGVPWDSKHLNDYEDRGGRPPEKLSFKGEPPPDQPVYVHKVQGKVTPALTNTGRDYDWNHQVTEDTPVTVVQTIPSWQKELMAKQSSVPEMGDAQYETISAATGDAGRERLRTVDNPEDQISAAWSEHQRHLNRDPHNESWVYPVGAGQSKAAAAHKLHGRTTFRGLNISIENRAGSYRHWYDAAADEKGKTLQKYPYGYIRMSEGMDGDHVDCYVGPNEEAKNVYVITTNKPPGFSAVDEQKCMLGFESAKEAKRVFLDHYNDSRFFRSLKALPFEKFKAKVLSTRTSAKKKIASNLQLEDVGKLDRGVGSTHNEVPGDFLGLPQSSLVGMHKIVGSEMDPRDTMDKAFRFIDEPMGTRVLEGNSQALPESPGV